MISSFRFDLLLVFAVWAQFNHLVLAEDNTLEKLSNLVKQPGWSAVKKFNKEIIHDGKLVDMDVVFRELNEDMPTSQVFTKHYLVQQISIMLSCEYTKQLQNYVSLVKGIIANCNDPNNNNGSDSNDCQKLLVENIICIQPMVTDMLSSLTQFYIMSPYATDFRQLYVALMTIKLYAENISDVTIGNKIKGIERLMLLVDLRAQVFAVRHCVSDKYASLWSSDTPPAIDWFSALIMNIVNNLDEHYFSELGFENSSLYIKNTGADLSAVWELLDAQQPEGYKTRIQWLDGPKEVTDVINEVKSAEYDTDKLAAFQKATLKGVAQLVYKQILETVEVTFKVHEKPADEGLCPPGYLSALTKEWHGLKKYQLTAIKAACSCFGKIKTKLACTEIYLNSLKRVWLYFSDINVPAITSACTAALNHVDRQTGILGTVSSLGTKIWNVRNRYGKTKVEENSEKTLSIDENPEFWVELKNVLYKVRYLGLPAETTETLETIFEYLENEQNAKDQQVVQLLELEMKNVIADFAEDNRADVDPTTRLRHLDQFADHLKDNESIRRVSLINGLVWDPSVFDRTHLLTNHISTEQTEGEPDVKFCRLSVNVVKLFKIYDELASFDWPTVFRQMLFEIVIRFADDLSRRVPQLVKFVFHQLSIPPKPETVNLRNALVLLKLYVNDHVMNMKTQEKYEIWRMDKFHRLLLLIVNQLEMYLMQNCDIEDHQTAISYVHHNATLRAHWAMFADPFGALMGEIDNEIALLDTTSVTDDCEVNIGNATFEKLIDNAHHDSSPWNCIGMFRFMWNDTHETMKDIRNKVILVMNLVSLTRYQVLVQNCLTAILFGYMINILKAANRPEASFSYECRQRIVSTIENVDNIMHLRPKTDSLKYIINNFLWAFEGDNISQIKAKILQTKIERELNSYGIHITDYFNALEEHNIIKDQGTDDIMKTYVTPLEQFANEWMMIVKKDLNCVKNYMVITL